MTMAVQKKLKEKDHKDSIPVFKRKIK